MITFPPLSFSIRPLRAALRISPTSGASRLSLAAVAVAAVLSFSGCATQRVSDCESIAGDGWSVLKQPPQDAAQLLSLQGVPVNDTIVWLGKGPDHLVACNYQIGLISPGCSSSRAYEFARDSKGWESKGVLLSACNVDQ